MKVHEGVFFTENVDIKIGLKNEVFVLSMLHRRNKSRMNDFVSRGI